MAIDDPNKLVVDTNIITEKPKNIYIDPLSVTSLYLTIVSGKEELGTATGFIVEKEKSYYLITNWHVLNGKHPITKKDIFKQGKTPDLLLIWHHAEKLGS